MWPFNKKKKPNLEHVPPAITKKECDHKYRDFNWYVKGVYNPNAKMLEAQIYEPYVCIHCGHRKDIVLKEITRWPVSYEEADKIYDEFQKPYEEKLKDRAFVEDEIHDMLLVDRTYIDIYMSLHNPKSDGIIHKE